MTLALTPAGQRRHELENRITSLEESVHDTQLEIERLHEELEELGRVEAGESEEFTKAKLLLDSGPTSGATMELLERVVGNCGPTNARDERALKDVLWLYRTWFEQQEVARA